MLLAAVLGACAAATSIVVRRWHPDLHGPPRILAIALAFAAAVVAAHLLPGALGLFTPLGALLGALVAAGAALAAARGLSGSDPEPRGSDPEPRGSDPAPEPRGSAPAPGSRHPGPSAPGGGFRARAPELLAAVPALAAAGCAVALVRDVAGAPLTSIDALNFQVPVVVRWLQTDSLWGLHQFVVDYSNATYPQNGNLLLASVVLPFESAFLVRLVAVPFWALAALGAYAIARELGAGRPSALLAATALAAVPVGMRSGLEGAQTDAPMLAFFATGALFLLRHARTGDRRELVPAGVGLGLALGTKWYALTAVAVVLAVWAAAHVLAGGRPRRRALHALAPPLAGLTSLAALFGGFWLLRNWVEAGNPLFPQPLEPLFGAPRDVLRERGGFTLSHYLLDFDVWRTYLRPAFESSFGAPGAVLAAGTLGAAVALAAAGRHGERSSGFGRVAAVLAATLVLTAVYAVTPYSAFGPEGRPVLAAASTRYAFPALLGAAVLTGWAVDRLGRARPLAQALLALAVLDGLAEAFDLSPAKVAGGMAAVAALAAAAVWLRPRLAASRALAAGLATVLAAGAFAGADAVRRRAASTGYGGFDPTLAFVEAHAPAGLRIGVTGIWSPEGISPVLPSFGPRFGNEVAFVGEFRRHMLRAFSRREDFVAALGRLDLLVVGRGAPPRPSAREEEWARAAGWRPLVASERLALLAAPRRPVAFSPPA